MKERIACMIVAATALVAVSCETPPPPPPMPPPSIQNRGPSPAEIKTLTKAGISDEVIISQIRNMRVVYRLSTSDIIDLKDAGVSQKVIDFMINTPSTYNTVPPPPPRPPY
jgi:hypothetical protein